VDADFSQRLGGGEIDDGLKKSEQGSDVQKIFLTFSYFSFTFPFLFIKKFVDILGYKIRVVSSLLKI
jgi:hypothetical protein